MSDFWRASGHHLVERDAAGRLLVGDDLLRAYLARPEIVPPPEACVVERALHQRLLCKARARVESSEIGDIADRDAAENWRHLIAFRNTLLAHPTLEAAYLAIVGAPRVTVPPLFLNHLVQLILRNILDGVEDAFVLRAAELMFRPQRLTIEHGVMLLADEEVVDGSAVNDHASPLVAIFGDAKARGLDVLGPDTATRYHARSDAFDLVLPFSTGGAGRAAFADVIARWVKALLGTEVDVAPVGRIEDHDWAWFVGLDQDATAIGNALWNGEEPPGRGLERVVALFDLTFRDASEVIEAVAGRKVTLILAMSSNRVVRVKPQNLVAGLPLKRLVRAGERAS